MELSLGKEKGSVNLRRQRRVSRAQYWFRQMRQVVDCAMDWEPSPAPRPEQLAPPGYLVVAVELSFAVVPLNQAVSFHTRSSSA